ncbi:MAG: DUF1415 family protein [Deltaproteobacteria bacterium]|nr:DUF1415 family protein [Myxococcales bacterium]MDP3217898.1 DUF1415 family protein [Deltaproteobacteria bacterium]
MPSDAAGGGTADEALAREAKRLFRRYTVEIVEGLDMCPWAEAARRRSQVSESVELGRAPDVAAGAAWARRLGEDRSVEIGFLIWPRVRVSRAEFVAYVEAVREAYGREPGRGGVLMAMVGFHPEPEPDTTSALSLINFIRRCPDPTIQAIRLSTLEELRQRDGTSKRFMPMSAALALPLDVPARRPLHEVVSDANQQTVERLGVPHVEAIVADIHRDRDRSYRALGEVP